jgi:hypothetical protein
MRTNMWTRILVALCFFSLTAQANPSDVPESGTRVAITLAVASGELPEPEKLVESLKTVDGKHIVQVKVHKTSEKQEVTLDLWGGTVPQADIPQTLRDAFPVLASADIQVSTLTERPKLEGRGRMVRELGGEKGTVKRVVKIIKKEEAGKE